MTIRNHTHRISAIVTAPLLVGGILFGGMTIADSPIAGAQPSAAGQCSSMTMTGAQGVGNPSLMTRAGQINAAAGNNTATEGSMPVNCEPASHS